MEETRAGRIVTPCDVNNHEFCMGISCDCPHHDEEDQ